MCAVFKPYRQDPTSSVWIIKLVLNASGYFVNNSPLCTGWSLFFPGGWINFPSESPPWKWCGQEENSALLSVSESVCACVCELTVGRWLSLLSRESLPTIGNTGLCCFRVPRKRPIQRTCCCYKSASFFLYSGKFVLLWWMVHECKILRVMKPNVFSLSC